jgi:hypothetical protein
MSFSRWRLTIRGSSIVLFSPIDADNRLYPRTNDALHCAETAYRSGDDPPSHR